ncbi:uncharacterized protein LOC141691163 [Apium graveolens]|uniref:uncharacterized protein LOC141691163 n=1 Tax=Apium graveolens TaxID=4045 RepID=UPI003D7BE6E2
MAIPTQLEGSKVNSFMQIDQKRWDEEVLMDIRNERDRNLIKKIPLSRREEEDSWFWLPDEKDCFLVKSCYRILQWEVEAPYAAFWKKVWSLQLPNTHVLFECEVARAVWTQVGLQGIISIMSEDSVFDVIRKGFELCNKEKCANCIFADWKKAHEHQLAPTVSRGALIACRKWEKPPVDWVKINVDAALFEEIASIGLGSIVRGAEGQFIAAMSRRCEGLIPPREAEALCLKSTLLWLQTMGYRKCVFETDSQILARACQGVSDSSYFHTIVRDCIDLFQYFDDV